MSSGLSLGCTSDLFVTSFPEVFSSVLSSPTADGMGGLASLEYEPSSRVVKYVIHVDGLVDAGELICLE